MLDTSVVQHNAEETMAVIDQRIRETFRVLEKISMGIVNRNVKAIIVSGAAGCGKTYTLETVLNRATEQGKIQYESVKGSMSALGLYRSLYNNCEEGSVLVIDDCDSIFGDIDALNLLKAALDTGRERIVHWNKASRILEDADIPPQFEFKGACVFITNIDFSAEILRESKMAPHYKALLSRCMYMDLLIHSRKEILVRVAQVVSGAEFMHDTGLTRPQIAAMMKWLHTNLNRVRVLSIRTVIHLAALIKTDNDWEAMANATMLLKK